jgi:hypothetical protein
MAKALPGREILGTLSLRNEALVKQLISTKLTGLRVEGEQTKGGLAWPASGVVRTVQSQRLCQIQKQSRDVEHRSSHCG